MSLWLADEPKNGNFTRADEALVEAGGGCGSAGCAAQHYQRGFAEGLASCQTEWALRLESERLLGIESGAAERERWHREEATKLIESLDAAVVRMQVAIEDRIARILSPFLRQAVFDSCMVEFREQLRGFLHERKGPCLRIAAPPDFHAGLSSVLSEQGSSVEILMPPNGEAAMEFGDGVLETAMMPWLAKLGVEFHG